MRDLRDIFVIARRELLERVKSKWFVLITLLGPIGMVAMVLVPALLAARSVEGAKVEIVDRTGLLAKPLAETLTAIRWSATIVPGDTAEAVELARIRDKQINGFITIPADALDGGRILYLGDNGSNQTVSTVLRQVVRELVQAERGRRAGVPADKLAEVLKPVVVEAQHTSGKEQGVSAIGSFLIAYFLAFLLYMVITLYGVGVMRSVVQEKTSRVMELMVATVKPRSLMAGKIIGVGTAGLIQIVVWLGMAVLTMAYREQLLGWFGVTGTGPGLPPISIGAAVLVVVFFVLGFFFYASLYAAVGAMVSSEQDTQQVQMPVTMLMVIGIMCAPMISSDPRGAAASVMTMVPFWSSMLMPMRYVLGAASVAQVALSLGILVVSMLAMVLAAAKIYRVGVLMYGKRPSLGELFRWLRY
ncbi:MAG: ABC transporter permease [Myxococcales bacterium]|nr:ABC transporter permease [Myxococcales bacterium]